MISTQLYHLASTITDVNPTKDQWFIHGRKLDPDTMKPILCRIRKVTLNPGDHNKDSFDYNVYYPDGTVWKQKEYFYRDHFKVSVKKWLTDSEAQEYLKEQK